MKSLAAIALVFSIFGVVRGEWKQLPSLPDREGFAGSFAGVSHGALVVAGGANFPGKKPWEGGTKVWYDTVYVLEQPKGEWKVAGKLPRPLGYGVSVSYADGLVCIGGSNADRHYADAFRIEWRDGKIVIQQLPQLPVAVANASGALVGDVLYVAGGLAAPDARTTLKKAWTIDLSAANPAWKEIEPCPGSGRMLAVVAAVDGSFWLVGGVDLVDGSGRNSERRYLIDAYRYAPHQGWKQIADAPHPVTAAPSPAPTGASSFYVLGGDDGAQVKTSPGDHRGFGPTILRYDIAAEKWTTAGSVASPRVTVPCVLWNGSYVLPGGEVRPGVRTPEVWSWTPGAGE